jgi:N-acetylglucosaminyl-diphospho-decaprenol L-rhamnosyltransferase
MQLLDLSIIVVNWNTRELLRECLDAVYNTVKSVSFETIVVDNGSTDGSLRMLRNDFPQAELLANEENLGYAEANNQGISISKGKHVLLLNSDAVLQEGTVERMVAFLEGRREVGVVGPALILPNGSYQMGAGGFEFSLLTAFNYFSFLSKLSPLSMKGLWLEQKDSFKQEIEVDWVSGACLMARAELFRTVGSLDTSYFMYMEDVEWCRRVREAGYKIFYLPFARTIHQYRASSSKHTATEWLESVDSYYRLRHGRAETTLFHLTAACGFLVRSLLYALGRLLLRRRDFADKRNLVLAYGRKSLALAFR